MLQLSAKTSRDFHAAVTDISATLNTCSGWVTNHHFYSNIMAMVAFELPVDKLGEFIAKLNQADIHVSLPDLWQPVRAPDIKGQINITFLHSKPDFVREIPAFDI